MSLLGKIESFTRKYLFWTPYYSRKVGIITSEPPEVYNAYGKRLHVFFISDREFAHGPYYRTNPRYILWDRYNYALKTHFYTHYEAFNLIGRPDKRFAVLNESRAVSNACYRKYLRERKYFENEFNYVFTFDEEILDKIANSKLVPFGAGFNYGEISPDNYKYKDKNISILASNKHSARLHVIRQETARYCLRNKLADTFGNFKGGDGVYVPIELPFKRYRYSIVIENYLSAYYFTEKIFNCFISQTIPVYLGASRIHEFFNPDGIITLSLDDINHNLEKVLTQCTPEEYERRLPAVLDNYERAKEFANIYDYMFAKHLKTLYE